MVAPVRYQRELDEVGHELARQLARWGDQRHGDFKWLTILMEEVGEASESSLDGFDANTYDELIQVAAVAVNHARTIRLRAQAVEPPS